MSDSRETPAAGPRPATVLGVAAAGALLAVGTFGPLLRRPARGAEPQPSAAALGTPDQGNQAAWTGGWTNFENDARQEFVPTLPRLTGVEIDVVAGNPGPDAQVLTLDVFDAKGALSTRVSQAVGEPGPVRFALPGGGLPVVAGARYAFRVRGGHVYGWKYTAGACPDAPTTFNGALLNGALLNGGRSCFVFRVFGTR